MAEISLHTEDRTLQGSRASRRLREAGRIPAVVYGHHVEPRAVSVDLRALRAALSTAAGANAVFALELGGTRHLAMAREVQHDPVRRRIAHVDFQVVNRDEVVHAEVPVVLVGEALEVARIGGTVEHLLVAVSVRARPAEIPSVFELDVTDLRPGDTVALGALALAAGVELETDPDTLVAVAHGPRVQGAGEGAETAEAPAES